MKWQGAFQMLVCRRSRPGSVLLWHEGATRWQHFWMFRIHPGATSQGAGVSWHPIRSTPSLVFRRIKSPDQNVLVLSQRWEKRGPKQKAWISMVNIHLFQQNQHWTQVPVGQRPLWMLGWIVLVYLRNECLFGQMLYGGRGTLQCVRKYILTNLSSCVLETLFCITWHWYQHSGSRHNFSHHLETCTIVWHETVDSFCY